MSARGAAAAAALLLVLAGCGTAIGKSDRTGSAPQPVTGGRQTPPPWAAPAEAVRLIQEAGLPALESEGAVVHYHAHLDVIVDGKAVTVPALIGIDERARRISPLHTHTPDGVLHVEAPARNTFTLGQFFTEWNVRLTDTCVGSLCKEEGKSLRLYVGGKLRPGDPTTVVLARHQEIALVYGDETAQGKVPSKYDFPRGL